MAQSSVSLANWTSTTRCVENPGRVVLESNLRRRHEVRFVPTLLSDDGETLYSAFAHAPTMIVTTPSVDRHYGAMLRQVVRRFGNDNRCGYHVLECSEQSKGIHLSLKICELALDSNLRRGGAIVAVGGGRMPRRGRAGFGDLPPRGPSYQGSDDSDLTRLRTLCCSLSGARR